MLQTFDERNRDIRIWVGDRLWSRDEARISVLDSSVQGGDAVWEGLRVYSGRRIFRLQRHLNRLRESAHALAFEGIPPEAFIRKAIAETLEANKMNQDAHIRLTLTRGVKITSGMDPRLNREGCTLIVLAEFKAPVYAADGIRLITSSVRRNGPAYLDSHIHHNNLLNNILAKIEANVAGADDALMLDGDGFVAETNATNFFVLKNVRLCTPAPDACLPGITREVVIRLAIELGIPVEETRLTLSRSYTADVAFCSGTMGELCRVREIDGRRIGDLHLKQTAEAERLYAALVEAFRTVVERESERC